MVKAISLYHVDIINGLFRKENLNLEIVGDYRDFFNRFRYAYCMSVRRPTAVARMLQATLTLQHSC